MSWHGPVAVVDQRRSPFSMPYPVVPPPQVTTTVPCVRVTLGRSWPVFAAGSGPDEEVGKRASHTMRPSSRSTKATWLQ